MFTNRAKILGATILGVVVVGALGFGQYQNTKEIVRLENTPTVITKTVVVTPTVEPTATPSAVLRTTRIYTPASASKSAK